MEIIIISFVIGVIVVAGPLLISLLMKDSGEDHQKVTTEDMEIVLENFRMGASRYEERVIDAILQKIGEGE